MKTVSIIGFGYVGKNVSKFFKDHYTVKVYDPQYEGHPNQDKIKFVSKEDACLCDFSVVCVPTPIASDGKCDLSYVQSVFTWLKAPLIILKSTVTPGTTDKLCEETGLNICFSPEFCGESRYWTPYKYHSDIKETPWFIFGGNPKATAKAVDLYMTVVGPTKTYRQTTAKAAELCKYVENCFYFTKIIFCYEIANICNLSGQDYNLVRDLWTLDNRFSPMHTAVFEENDVPVSGRCLPKDLSALIEFSKSIGYNPNFLSEVVESNKRIGEFRKNHPRG